MKCYKTFSLNIVSWIIHYETSVRFTISVNALLRSHWAPLVLSDFVKPLGVLGSVASVRVIGKCTVLFQKPSEEQYVELLQKLMLTLILNSMFIFFSCSHEFSVDTGILFASSFCIFIHAYLGFCVADYEDCYIAPVNVQFMSTYN